jgi:TRAP-type C4-dicarboxylate transport system substrate-binding protein
MNKKHLPAVTVLGGLMLGGLMLGSSASAQTSFSLAHGSPANHVITKEFVEPWMACVKEQAGDKVEFKYFPSGQLANLKELLPALERGVADVAPVPIGYYSDKLPLNGVSMLPGLGSTSEEVVTAYGKTIQSDALTQEFNASGIVPLSVMAFPPYQIVSVSEEIKTPEQFNGKVVRSAGGAMDLVIKSLGGSPAAISIGDTYVALQRGTADATISALASVDGYKLQELAKSISTNGSFGTFVNVMSVRQSKWNEMDDSLKQTFMDCGQKIQLQAAQNLDNAGAGLSKKFADVGVDMFAFTPEQINTMSGKLDVVHQDWVTRLNGRGLPAEVVLQTYKSNF